MEESEAKLQPGVAFRLQPDGQWKPEKIPPEVLKEAKFSGYLTIQGYRCTVFETPDKNQWAQKSTGTTASKIAARWLRTSSKTWIFEMPGDQNWDPAFWDRIGVGPEWDKIAKDFEAVGADVDESEDIVITCPDESEQKVLQIIEDAKSGKYGPDLQTYWNAAVISAQAGGEDIEQSQQQQATTAMQLAEQWLVSHGVKPPAVQPMRSLVVSRVASQIASRWLQAQGDITSLVQKKMDRDGDDKAYDKAIVDFVTKTRTKLPSIDTALAKACDVLLNTREKIEHKHPKVQDHYVQMFLQELAQKHRELEDMRKQLMRGLTVELDRYESEANPVGDEFGTG